MEGKARATAKVREIAGRRGERIPVSLRATMSMLASWTSDDPDNLRAMVPIMRRNTMKTCVVMVAGRNS